MSEPIFQITLDGLERASGISKEMFRILELLLRHPNGLPPTEIGMHFGRPASASTGWASPKLGKLIERGFVEKSIQGGRTYYRAKLNVTDPPSEVKESYRDFVFVRGLNDNQLKALEVVGKYPEGLQATDMAVRCGIPEQRAHAWGRNMTRSLVKRGLFERVEKHMTVTLFRIPKEMLRDMEMYLEHRRRAGEDA